MTGDLFNKMQGNVIMCGFVGYIKCVTDDSCFGAKAAISREHQQKALDTLEYRAQTLRDNGRINTFGLGIAGCQSSTPARAATSRWNMATLSLPLTG